MMSEEVDATPFGNDSSGPRSGTDVSSIDSQYQDCDPIDDSFNNNNNVDLANCPNELDVARRRLSSMRSEILGGDDRLIRQLSDLDLRPVLDEHTRIGGGKIDVLIMSEAGKPIYCHSDREDAITLMGVCVTLVNYVLKTQNDQLKSIHTRSGMHINFCVRSPLVMVVVCSQHSCFDQQTLINQVHAQVISTITLKKLKSIFQQAPTYDLKRIIHKNDFKTLDILIKSITTPITDHFITYRHRRPGKRLKGSLFNNVLSFLTSPLMSAPRSTTNSTNNSNANSSLVFMHDHKPNVLSRVYVPIAIMNVTLRDQITSMIQSSVATNSDIVFSILFLMSDEEEDECDFVEIESHRSDSFASLAHSSGTDELSSEPISPQSENQSPEVNSANPPPQRERHFKLVSVCNHAAKFRISPLDIQLLHSLIKASDSLLSSTESLWLPLSLSRVDPNRFLHAHISYLSRKYCLILLDVDHNNFEKCRQVKESIQFKLEQLRMAEPMVGLRSSISELGQPHLQYLCHQTPRHCIVWQSSIQSEFSSLNYYLVDRMQRSSLKTLWLRSSRDQCALLGWQTANFQLYAQFDLMVSQYAALETVQSFIKWFKKEEDKLVIKDV